MMSDTDSAGPVAEHAAAGSADGDERGAGLVLARLAGARVMMAGRPAARITMIVAAAVLAVAGVWLRSRGGPRWQAVAGTCAAAALAACAVPALSVLAGRKEPGWVRAARVRQRPVEGRIPAGTAGIVRRCTAGLRGRTWREAYLYVSRCTGPEPAHWGVCQTAGVYPMDGRLLVILGEHLAAGPSQVTAAVLGHEPGHAAGWRPRLSYQGAMFAMAGWVIIGWAVPWPFLPPAAIGLMVTLTALSWAVEAGCDLGSALAWITGPPHPPLPVRRALIRAGRGL
jgi:hypothetical protein